MKRLGEHFAVQMISGKLLLHFSLHFAEDFYCRIWQRFAVSPPSGTFHPDLAAGGSDLTFLRPGPNFLHHGEPTGVQGTQQWLRGRTRERRRPANLIQVMLA
jgi:hypothetical protein